MRSILSVSLLSVLAACSATDGTSKAAVDSTAGKTALTRPGFTTLEVDGRLWVFADGSPDLTAFQQHGELAKCVTRVGAGPGGMTIKAPDAATIDAWLAAR